MQVNEAFLDTGSMYQSGGIHAYAAHVVLVHKVPNPGGRHGHLVDNPTASRDYTVYFLPFELQESLHCVCLRYSPSQRPRLRFFHPDPPKSAQAVL
jgi:hypothetical protein